MWGEKTERSHSSAIDRSLLAERSQHIHSDACYWPYTAVESHPDLSQHGWQVRDRAARHKYPHSSRTSHHTVTISKRCGYNEHAIR